MGMGNLREITGGLDSNPNVSLSPSLLKTPPPPTDRFGQGNAMEGLGTMGGSAPGFNRGTPGGDFGPNKRRRY